MNQKKLLSIDRITVTIFFCLILLIPEKEYLLASGRPLIFPIPQIMESAEEDFILDNNISLLLPDSATEKDEFLLRFLIRELSNKYGLTPHIKVAGGLPGKGNFILIGSRDNPLIKEYCVANNLELTSENPGPEGYYLQINARSVVIAGSDDAGAFYGLQSLRQLIYHGEGRLLQGIQVKDWPSFPFRAIRLYVPGPENIPYFKRFLRDFMALYKFNKVVMELNCMRLDNHPEVNAGWIDFTNEMLYSRSNSTEGLRGEEKNSSHYDAGDGFIIEKDDVRNLVDIANQNYIEVIPEIPSLTHGYYLLTRHPELAEYPGDIWPDTYCPSNPASYDLMFDVFDEYIEVIHPKMIHIGHDEWWGAPLGVCPLCRDKDYSELYAQDINRIHDYLSKKGIKIAMWGDHILESVRNQGPIDRISSTGVKYQTPGAMRPSVVKESVPKDILIFNWFWVNPDRDKELDEFGFHQIYGNFKPNITDWENRTKGIKLEGGAPSSWAATNEYNFGKDLMLDFLGCANLIWSSHPVDQVELGKIVRERMPYIRFELSLDKIPSELGDPVVPVNISNYFNVSDADPVFDLDLSHLRNDTIHTGSKIFKLDRRQSEKEEYVIAVGAKGKDEISLPAEVSGIPVHEDVSSLIFLHACARPAGNQKAYFNIPDFFDSADLLGWYEIVYEDDFRSIIPIQYGVNILEYYPGGPNSLDLREGRTGSPQNAYCYWGDPVDCSSSEEDEQIVFYAFEWVNPRFGKKINYINVHGSKNFQSQQRDYSHVESAPMASNAILLAGISKVLKREVRKPE